MKKKPKLKKYPDGGTPIGIQSYTKGNTRYVKDLTDKGWFTNAPNSVNAVAPMQKLQVPQASSVTGYTQKMGETTQYWIPNGNSWAPSTEEEYNRMGYNPTNTNRFIPTFAAGGTLPKYYNGTGDPTGSYADQQSAYNAANLSGSMMDEYGSAGGENAGMYGAEGQYGQDQGSGGNNYGQYAATGMAAGLAGANYASVYNDPNATTSDKAAAGRNGVASVAGTVSPVVGGIIGIANTIAAPIKKNAESMDSKGNLQNQRGAQAGAIVGNFLSPSTLATTISEGKWSLNGKAYTDSLESDAKAKIKADYDLANPYVDTKDYRQDAVRQQLNDYTPNQYAMGGNAQPNAEVELQENSVTPNGDFTQFNGPSHAQGGIPTQMEPGERIYSDRLKMPGTKKTFADLNKPNNTKAQDKVLESKDANSMAKATASLIADIKRRKSDDLFKAQEGLKQSKVQAYAKRLGVVLPEAQHQMPNDQMMDNNQMANGGTIPKYWWGGTDNTPFITPQERDRMQYEKDVRSVEEQGQLMPSGSLLGREQQYPDQIAENIRLAQEQNIQNKNININPQDSGYPDEMQLKQIDPIDYSNLDRTPRKQPNYGEYVEPAVNTLLQNSGNIADLAMTRFGKKYDKEDFGRLNPNYIKPQVLSGKEELRDADRQSTSSRQTLREVVGGNAGAYMANLSSNQTANTLNKAKIRESINNTNTGILNDADKYNQGIKSNTESANLNLKNQGRIAEQQNKARSEDIARQAVRGIGMNTSAAYHDYKSGKMDQQTLGMISSMFKTYKLDMNNPNHWDWVMKNAKGGNQ